jgi:hypothetical protein
MGVCIMEQSRHARRFFDLAWFGIGAAGAVDPMAAAALLRRVETKRDQQRDHYVRTV